MSWLWTNGLLPPLAEALANSTWRRVDEGRGGGWFAQEEAGGWCSVDASGELRPLSPFQDPGLPRAAEVVSQWLRVGHTVELLAHRFERRMVFRVSRRGSRFIAKLYRRETSQRMRWCALAESSAPGVSWRVPRVLGWDDDTLALQLQHVTGEAMHDRWVRGAGAREDGALLSQLLDWLARAPIPTGLERHGASEEALVLATECERCVRTRSRLPAGLRGLVDLVRRELESLPTPQWVVAHRDLHDKQLLCDLSGGTLIDLDLCAVAPIELDRGNLLAHARLRALQGLELPWSEVAAEIASGYGAASRQPLAVWTAAALARLALVYGRRSHRSGLLEELTSSAGSALRSEGEWGGIL
ncbi:MAG: hypothetical protein AB7O52_03575 [Planctomycetota bacterium]